MNTPPFSCLQIRTCENGWEVTPKTGYSDSVAEVFVFETWESLTDWMSDNLLDKTDE